VLARWLLIGNSRWHWAGLQQGGLQGWSELPPDRLAGIPSGSAAGALLAWAAVGPVPLEAALDPARRLLLADVPLQSMPPWLGIDRALAAWQAHRLCGRAVLVADAGTALSFTRVSAGGTFAGGRLLAGAGLQMRALAAGTSALPSLSGPTQLPAAAWPQATAEAMAAGVLRGLAAAVDQAWQEACGDDPHCRLWLTGGDAPVLAPLLGVTPEPLLALQALASLRPAPGQ
jgi:type III pantothenate kinase